MLPLVEFRRALFDKGAIAFLEICRLHEPALLRSFELERPSDIHIRFAVEKYFGDPESLQRRPSETASQSVGFLHQLIVGKNSIGEPDAQALFGIDRVAGEQKFRRP